MLALLIAMSLGFQSTRPMRGGTVPMSLTLLLWAFQSTRPVRGGTRRNQLQFAEHREFQSTRPVRGGTCLVMLCLVVYSRFQSTRPVRGGTCVRSPHTLPLFISIHPPRAGRDRNHDFLERRACLFQSTRPVRGGTHNHLTLRTTDLFQSTRPVRGGTIIRWRRGDKVMISIHPPRAGRDINCKRTG